MIGAVLSCALMINGWIWDISWHRSIGRDTIWTLPHNSIFIALGLAFVYNAALVLMFTFGRLKPIPAIKVLGFRAPGGAFITLWGILLQFMAILFDDYWHDIYGLDVGVFSPPHALLAWGIGIFYLGQFVLIATVRNQAYPRLDKATRWTLMALGGFLIGHFALAMDASYGPRAVRTHAWMITSATWAPFVLILPYAYLRRRWASVGAASIYMLFVITLMQIFWLFPATPLFGPVFHPITHFLPPPFPMLMVLPALAISWVLTRKVSSRGLHSFLLAITFLLSFHIVNWLFSGFLLSPGAENRLFAGHLPGAYFEEEFRPVREMFFSDTASSIASLKSIGIAFFAASGMSWVALSFGHWLQKVKR